MSMPIFESEAAFRTGWIGPFLSKLGYIVVTHSHGPDEQGKDFIFADFDRFEHMRLYAVQAKNGNIGTGTTEIEALLGQVRRAFTVRVKFRSGLPEQRVSGVYIMASGRISPQAREYITESCNAANYGANVQFLDGERLDLLDRYAAHRADQNSRLRLTGLMLEVVYNLKHLAYLRGFLPTRGNHGFTLERCRVDAMAQCMAVPFPPSILQAEQVDSALEEARSLNAYCETMHIAALANPGGVTDDAKQSVAQVDKAIATHTALQGRVLTAIHALDERYQLVADTEADVDVDVRPSFPSDQS